MKGQVELEMHKKNTRTNKPGATTIKAHDMNRPCVTVLAACS